MFQTLGYGQGKARQKSARWFFGPLDPLHQKAKGAVHADGQEKAGERPPDPDQDGRGQRYYHRRDCSCSDCHGKD